MNYSDIRGLDKYADTEIEKRVLKAVKENPTVEAAAAALGYASPRTVYSRLANIRAKAKAAGFDASEFVPAGHTVQGLSTLVRLPEEDGSIALQWVKTKADAQLKERLLEEARQAMVENLPRAKPVKSPRAQPEELCNLYILTDYHIGMHAWGEQTGADYDLKIAEELLLKWFTYAIKKSPRSNTCVLAQLGDFLHWDGILPVTVRGGNILDADNRFQKVVRIAIRLLRQIVTMLLKKHEHVHLIMAEGNHDPAGSIWLREMSYAMYQDEPRITVDRSPTPYYCFEWSDTSLFFHHGHKKRPNNIDDVFAGKYREVFGRTKFSYAHMGHMHHDKALETNLMTVEQHRTLAAADAYADSLGFTSGRSAPVITYHKKYGEVGRLVISPEMVL